jgi:DNA helicase-2/ATP-dependent DNA helicase PcrA
MAYYADLHIHSRWSIATSRDLNIEALTIAACKKGISILGTGDCTHPSWLKELEGNLEPAEEGLFKLRSDLEHRLLLSIPTLCHSPVRYILEAEVSTVYKKAGKTRKIHNLVYLPDFISVHRLNDALSPFGSLKSDGRPTLLMDAKDLLKIILDIHPKAFLIPAHIWTPWFSVLGSKSRFNSIEECYEELTSHIFAVETGLSSDPPMNWRLSSLDQFQLVSNSDAHSASKIGRKATIFSCPHSFQAIRAALSTGDGLEGTVEMYPQEGKYYLDGHRKCGFSCIPEKTQRLEGLCPKCHKPLTQGVVHRLEELANREEGQNRPFPKPFTYCIPLTEILAEILNVRPANKRVQETYNTLITSLGPELKILSQTSLEDINAIGVPLLSEAVARMRKGMVRKLGGFDGQYGTVHVFS